MVVLVGNDVDMDYESAVRNGALRVDRENAGEKVLKQRLTLLRQMIAILLLSPNAMAHFAVYTLPSRIIRPHHVPP